MTEIQIPAYSMRIRKVVGSAFRDESTFLYSCIFTINTYTYIILKVNLKYFSNQCDSLNDRKKSSENIRRILYPHLKIATVTFCTPRTYFLGLVNAADSF